MKLYKEQNHLGYIALGLGVVSMMLWLIPVAGFISSIACLIFVYMAMEAEHRSIAIYAMVLGIIGILLTIVRVTMVYLLV